MMKSLGVVLASVATASSVTPMEQVVNMLEEMVAKSLKAKKAEDVAFSEFSTMCENNLGRLKKDVKAGEEEQDRLEGSIAKAKGDASDLADEINGLSDQIVEAETRQKKITSIRKEENSAYRKRQKDLSESVDALGRAVQILKRKNFNIEQEAVSFFQTSSEIPDHARKLAEDFLALGADDGPSGAPAAYAYESQTGNVIALLRKLEDDFQVQLNECEKAELNSKHAYEMEMQHLTDSVDSLTETKQRQAAAKGAREQDAARDESLLATCVETLQQDNGSLADLSQSCHEKTLSYNEKQKLRTDEIDALNEAVRIIGAVPQGSTSLLAENNKRIATTKAISLLQLSSSTPSATQQIAENNEAVKIVHYLRDQSTKIGSDRLALLASKISEDPFVKVKALVRDMITRLMDEQRQDTEKKGYCDTELKKNRMTRKRLNGQMEALQAEIDSKTAEAAQLSDEVAQHRADIVALNTGIKDATAQRNSEHDSNEAAVKEAEAAQEAIVSATDVLRSFYARASGATAFIQTTRASSGSKIPMDSEQWKSLANPNYPEIGPGMSSAGYSQGSEDKVDTKHTKGMQTFGETYSGRQENAHGVLAMLELILEDFAEGEASTKAAESQGAQAYKLFMRDSEKSLALAKKNIDLKEHDRLEAETEVEQGKQSYGASDDQLRAAKYVFEKLKPQCLVDDSVTFAERRAKMQEEIQSLKEALEMLKPQGEEEE